MIFKEISGVKTINNRSIEEILSDVNANRKDLEILETICNNINSEKELIVEFRKYSAEIEPTRILRYIMLITNEGLEKATDYLDEILTDDKA